MMASRIERNLFVCLEGIQHMTIGYLVTGVISVLIAVYLFSALLWPEKF